MFNPISAFSPHLPNYPSPLAAHSFLPQTSSALLQGLGCAWLSLERDWPFFLALGLHSASLRSTTPQTSTDIIKDYSCLWQQLQKPTAAKKGVED